MSVFLLPLLVVQVYGLYHLEIRTADILWAGTDSDISAVITGTKGSVDSGLLDNKFTFPWRKFDDFERNDISTFYFEGNDVGEVKSVRLMTAGSDMWMVYRVKVSHQNKQYYMYNIMGQWLSQDETEGESTLDLYVQGNAAYDVIIHTNSTATGAGSSDIQLRMVISGSNGNTTTGILDHRHSDGFEQGRTTTFSFRNMWNAGPGSPTFPSHILCIDLYAGGQDEWLFDWIIVNRITEPKKEVTFKNHYHLFMSSDEIKGVDHFRGCYNKDFRGNH